MFKKLAEVVVCGAIGAAALYVVGKIAYQAGREMGQEESRYRAMHQNNAKTTKPEPVREEPDAPVDETALTVVESAQEPVKPKKKQSKLGLLFGAGRMFGNKKTVLGRLVRNPEDHKFEAYVEGDELQIHVKRKEAS